VQIVLLGRPPELGCRETGRSIWSVAAEDEVTYDRHHKSWWRRALSIALAQFVAIQLVLSAAVAVQMVTAAPIDAATLCADNHSGPSGDGGQNHVVVHHGFCAVCTYAAHGAPLPGAI
jgi:hypothetical protein